MLWGVSRCGGIGVGVLAGLVLGCPGVAHIRQDTPTAIPPGPYFATLRASGLDPSVVHVYLDRRATFVNEDTKTHLIFSDPHPGHSECGGALNLGPLLPGERREVTNLPFGVCGFHDDTDPANPGLRGTLVIH